MRREVRDDSGSDHERSAAEELADREGCDVVLVRVRARFHSVPPDVSLADELIQERRAEALREFPE